MPEQAYHEIPYLTAPMQGTHPDRLASVAALFGMQPAPPDACRMLEIGCGSGGNLLPMAFRLPGSRFTGVDLAANPIAEGRRVAEELALPNLELIAMDLRDIGPSLGQFDYIAAHGVYSWIPDEFRDRLFEVCRERLAPHGVVFISFNTLPGRYIRIMLRDMLLYHNRHCADPRERIERARDLLRRLGESPMVTTAWQPMIQEEVRVTAAGDDGWFYHDDLAEVNDAFHIRDFVERAASHGLQYLGDGQPHLMFDSRMPLDWVGGGLIEREQYFDFLCLRPFRQTLLCASEVELVRPPGPERMDLYRFFSPARQSDGQVEGFHSVCLKDAPEAVMHVAAAMGSVYPAAVSFESLVPLVGTREALRNILFTLVSSGFASFQLQGRDPVQTAGPYPRATRLARWESARTGIVTYGNHIPNKLDAMVRGLLELLDGTRNLDELSEGLAQVEGAPPLASIRERLPWVLTHLSHAGLLED